VLLDVIGGMIMLDYHSGEHRIGTKSLSHSD
jgi:hypothetical protein